MVEIINYAIIAVLIVTALTLIRFTVKRCMLLVKLCRLKRETGAEIKLHTFPLRPMWAMGRGPDITV